MNSHLARTLSITLAATALFGAAAEAQTDPDVMARTRRDLAREALAARASNDHARALDLAERAGELGMSLSLRRFIAEEQNALGLFGMALRSAELCVRESERDVTPARAEHFAACQTLAVSLRPRVARPGVAGPRSQQVPPDPRGGLNPAPVAMIGIGAAGFIATGVFYLMRGSALNDRDQQCDATGCPESARPDHDRAVTFNTLTNVSLGVGAMFAAGGLVWYLIAPRRAGPALVPSAHGAVVGWQGSF